ncbi:MAG: hypothetical protein PHU12_04410 [Candidatus Aenigmarchaeota archaeon]|nr:hypothetical protein [Candidatus Aenigmarchaeota archaeon]
MTYEDSITRDLIIYLSQCPEYQHKTNKHGKIGKPHDEEIAKAIGVTGDTVRYHIYPEYAKKRNKTAIKNQKIKYNKMKEDPKNFILKEIKKHGPVVSKYDKQSILTNQTSIELIFDDEEVKKRLGI